MSLPDDDFATDSLREAAAFRKYADERVTKIFKRTFQEHYPIDLPPLVYLDPHQRAGVCWALSRKRSYLAHAPGAGKTAEAIIAAHFAKGEGQCVFIVPPALAANWERELLKVTDWVNRWPSIGVVRTSDEKELVAWRADFLIVPDSKLTKPWVYTRLSKMKLKLLAVDEASRFKECSANRSLALYGGGAAGHSWRGLFRDARHVVFLDGSPMPNRPIELWAPTYALHPEAIDCMSMHDFGYKYCGAKPNERGVWEFKYSSHEGELRAKLTKDFMHVVTEEELSHPERRRSMLFIKDVRTHEMKEWERKNLSKFVLSDDEIGEVAHQRKLLGLRKVKWVAKYVKERLDDKGESILLFAWHREVVTGLAKRLEEYRPGVIMGGVSAKTREKEFAEFQSGRKKLLILNVQAGGRGHNLQRADRVIFAEFSWTDENNKQCEKRASRRGSTRDFIRTEYIVCPNSMDEVVLSSVFTKEKRVKKVIG